METAAQKAKILEGGGEAVAAAATREVLKFTRPNARASE